MAQWYNACQGSNMCKAGNTLSSMSITKREIEIDRDLKRQRERYRKRHRESYTNTASRTITELLIQVTL